MIVSYVLNDIEVKLTDRTASRHVGAKKQELVEVTPLDQDNGTWRKWVAMASLFKIDTAPGTPSKIDTVGTK